MMVVCNVCTTLFVIELRYVVEIGSSDDAVFASKRCRDNSKTASKAKRKQQAREHEAGWGSVHRLILESVTPNYLT